ncbi:MAG: GldG family protein [Clostridia bacterium]|nr:GldG family protein [Clostridia bacterium]
MKTKRLNDSVRFNLLFALLMALLVVIAFLFNAVMSTLSERYQLSADLTANAAYEIGDDTKAVLDLLTEDVSLYVLSGEGGFDGNAYLVQARRIIEQYPKYNGRVRLSYIDYTADPTFAANYPSLTLSSGDILVVSEKGLRQVPLANLFNYTYNASGSLTVESSRAEEALTSAILSVITEDPVTVAFLTGNGASEDTATFQTILKDNGFEVVTRNIVTDELSDCEILVLLAPMTDLSEDALKKLDDFLYNGGDYGRTLLYAADVSQPELTNVAAFLREWGISVDDGAVFETSEARAYSYQPYYPLAAYESEEYAALLKDRENPVLLPLSRPLTALFEFRDNRYVETLLAFYETAGVRPSDADDGFTASQATRWGPMPALTLSSIRLNGAEGTLCSNLIVSASSAMFGASGMANTSLANAEYTVALFNALTERENVVSIEPKSLAGNTLGISTAAASRWGVLLCAALPLAILGAGVTIWLLRRYK